MVTSCNLLAKAACLKSLVQDASLMGYWYRALLNVDMVDGAIRQQYPDAILQTVYAEGMDFGQQVLAAASASILILVHGASLANFLFLPKVYHAIPPDTPHHLYVTISANSGPG